MQNFVENPVDHDSHRPKTAHDDTEPPARFCLQFATSPGCRVENLVRGVLESNAELPGLAKRWEDRQFRYGASRMADRIEETLVARGDLVEAGVIYPLRNFKYSCLDAFRQCLRNLARC